MELKRLENGQLEIDGTVYDLPNAITTVSGIPEDMLILKLMGISYTDCFKAGCKQLIDNYDDGLEAMKAELEESMQAKDALTMKIKRLNASISEKESAEQEEVKASDEQFEHIVAEFERLAYSVYVDRKDNVVNHLIGLHGSLDKASVFDIYFEATPDGKVVPDTRKLREVLENYLL